MKDKLNYLLPTAAVTSLFLAGCGDDEGVTVDACEGVTGTEALLAGSWTLTKEDGISTQGKIFEDDLGDEYTYTLVYKFECGGDFDIRQVLVYTDDAQNPLVYSYEGSWDFKSADETIDIEWTNDENDVYEWDFEVETISESSLKGSLFADGDTVLQEFTKQ